MWNSSLTGDHISKLERIQKTALHVILGECYRSYNQALKQCGLVKLSDRRRLLCITFAKKSLKDKKFSKWFKPSGNHPNTRQDQPAYCSVYRKHDRFQNSPISYLTELLNTEFSKPKWVGNNLNIVTVNYRGIEDGAGDIALLVCSVLVAPYH